MVGLGVAPQDEYVHIGGGKLLEHANVEIRAGFISKVYGILTAQLMITAAVAAPFAFIKAVQEQLVTPIGWSVLIAVSLLNIVFLLSMTCCGCQENLRKFPRNYILLGGFTVTEGVLVGIICSRYDVKSVFLAVLLTAVLVLALTIYAKTTKRDFTGLGAYLFVFLLAFMCFGVLCIFFPFPFMQNVYCAVGILLFSLYLIYDTQKIMGKGALALTEDDYIFGALTLYMDIIQIFMFILELAGNRS